MIVCDVMTKVLDTESFPQNNIAGLISVITFIVLFSQENVQSVERNKQAHTHIHTHTHTYIYTQTHTHTHTHTHTNTQEKQVFVAAFSLTFLIFLKKLKKQVNTCL